MKLKMISPQTWAFLGFSVAMILMACLAGCGTTEYISHVEPMAYCDDGLAPSLLSDPCDKVTPLPAGAIFQDSLDGNRKGSIALDACALKAQKLQEALAACHKAVSQHNQVIQSLNKPS